MKRRPIIGLIAVMALVVAACTRAERSPTDTFKAFYEAAKNKDAEAVKKLLSKGALKSLEDFAREKKTTVDEVVKDNRGVPERMPATRNEKIDGDRAMLEYNDDKRDKWIEVPFVKEDGEWKLELDKVR